MFSTGLLVVYM